VKYAMNIFREVIKMKHCIYIKRDWCSILNCNINKVSKCYLDDELNNLSSIELYLKKYNPKELIRYKNFIRKNSIPKIGSIVVAIINGFACGSEGGTIMQVISHENEGFSLQMKNGKESWCSNEDWWNKIMVIEGE